MFLAKEFPAALYMMVTKGLLSAGARDSDDLKYLLKEVNLHLYRTCKRKVFVTMAAISLDPAGGRCFYGRAGHNPMIWRRTGRGETRILKSRGLGLGMVASESFGRTLKIQELDLEAGDALVLYSDGITEAVNATMQQYGEQRLLRAVDATDGQSAEAARADDSARSRAIRGHHAAAGRYHPGGGPGKCGRPCRGRRAGISLICE